VVARKLVCTDAHLPGETLEIFSYIGLLGWAISIIKALNQKEPDANAKDGSLMCGHMCS